MKKALYLIIFLCLAFSAVSCKEYDECPKITKGYADKFILPSPTKLNNADKEYLEELRKEYKESIDKE